MNQFLSWTSPQWPTFPSLFNPCEMKSKRIVPESLSCSLAGWWSEFYHGFHTQAWRNCRKTEIKPREELIHTKQKTEVHLLLGQHVWITIKVDTKRSLPGQHAQRSDIQRAHQHGQSHSRSLSLDHLFGCLGRNRPLLVTILNSSSARLLQLHKLLDILSQIWTVSYITGFIAGMCSAHALFKIKL